MLLKRQITVNSYEDIKLDVSQSQELAVSDSRPSLSDDGMNFDRVDMIGKPTIYTFVEKNLQAASCPASVAARSRNATTRSRVTEGNPLRKSSIVSPASISSSKVCTGTPVPGHTGVPPIMSEDV